MIRVSTETMLKIKSNFLSFIFAASIFGGFVAQSCSAYILPACENKLPKSNFNARLFFRGKWYVTHVYQVYGSYYKIHNPRICMKIKSEFNEESLNQYYTLTMLGSDETIYLHGNASHIKQVGKHLTLIRIISVDGYSPIFKAVMLETIIDTDYKSYALGYYCVKHKEELVGTNFALLGRSPNPDYVHPNIEALYSQNLTMDVFDSTKDLNCPL